MGNISFSYFNFLLVVTALTVILLLITTKFYRILTKQSRMLQLNQQYYKSLFDQNPDAILTFDLKGNFISANKATASMFGYTFEEIVNKPFFSLVVPKDVEKAKSHFKTALEGKPINYELSVFDKVGNQREVKGTKIPIMVNGEITGIYAIIKDITEQKQVQKTVIEAEAKYRSIVENSQVGVYIFQDGKIVYINPRLCELLGYRLEELITLKLSDYVIPEDMHLIEDNIRRLLTKQDATITSKFQAIRKDKSIINFEIYGSKINYDGKDAIIGTVIDITQRINSEKMIKHMAYHDQLTGLPNRYLLRETLKEVVKTSKEHNETFAFLFLDLDRFKAVNDSLGHEMGDKLLIEIGERLRDNIGERDIISRYGGDEFTLLLPDTDLDRAREVAQSIIANLSRPFYLNQHEIVVTPSIGISIFPEHGCNFDALIKKADLAMYFAKSLGKNNYQFYTDDLKEKPQHALDLEMRLRNALERREFELYYQPQISLRTNQLIGAEALIRWRHPKKGLISPADFIPLAEETGLIIPMGEWALRTACQQNKRWQDAGFPPITVAVNISAKQFFQSNLAGIVEKILIETGLEAKYLELEITESMTMDVDRAIATLLELKKIGVMVSIDDFGTGYSSLNYLKKFPIDKLKIDQSFIRDCTTDVNDETIVKTIISMAHNLKLQVIAEGVETREHISFLLQQLCTEAQGYYFSRPITVEEFEKNYNIARMD